MRGERLTPLLLVNAVNIALAKDLVVAVDSSCLQRFFCFSIPRTSLKSSLRGVNISKVAPLFRDLSLSSTSFNLQAPEVPMGNSSSEV